MARVSSVQNSFIGGEISPRLEGRVDLKIYYNSCRTLENFSVWPHGGAYKRPGTKYISTAGNPNHRVRLIPFVYSESQAYIIELGEKYARFYTEGGIILTNSGTEVYEIETPYDADDLPYLKFVQSADVMYFANPFYPPYKLARFDHDDWTLTEVGFSNGPFLDLNETNTAITPTSVTGTIMFTATSGTTIFDAEHVGSIWKIQGTEKKTKDIGAQNLFTEFIEIDSGEQAVVNITGTWAGTVTVQVSYDDGSNWLDLYTATDNVSTAFTESMDDVLYRVGVKTGDYTSGTVHCEIGKLNQFGYILVSEYISPISVSGTVQVSLPSASSTTKWAEGSWGQYRGYPSAVAFYEERLVFAGTDYEPATVWGSQVDDFENFQAGTAADDSYTFTLAADNLDIIHSLVPAGKLLHVFSAGGEWSFGYADRPTTPTDVSASRQTTNGCANIQALPISHVILFFQKGAKKLLQRYYHYIPESWIITDISKVAEHMLKEGAVEIAYTNQPDPIVWIVRSDGVLLGMTYDPVENLVAWHRHTTEGEFESIAVIPGEERDELWACVKRATSSGTTTRYIEQFQTTDWETLSDAVYLDSALSYTGTPATTVSGLDHLEGYEVSVTVSGAVHPNTTVSGGSITLRRAYSQITAGLPYTATLETMPIEVGAQAGTAQTKFKNISKVGVRLKDTMNLKVGSDENNLDIIPFRNTTDAMGSRPPLYTGNKLIEFPKGFDREVSVMLVSDTPTPANILSIIYTVTTSDH